MMRAALGFIAGVIFASGLSVARLTVPQLVQSGLDITGAWDPTMFVALAAGMFVYGLFRLLVRGRSAPLLADRFRLPQPGWPTPRMWAGSLLFGAAWGFSGICPGPSLTASLTSLPIAMFALAMLGGVAAYQRSLAGPATRC